MCIITKENVDLITRHKDNFSKFYFNWVTINIIQKFLIIISNLRYKIKILLICQYLLII